MDISFQNARLQKVCNSEKETNREFGPECGKKLRRRLAELAAAVTLKDMMTLPQARCHALKGGRSSQFTVDLKHPKRLIFEPSEEPLPRLDDGGLDLSEIRKVRIVEVVDYHD